MQGQNVFGKNSHEPLKKEEGILKISVLKLLLSRSVDSEEKKGKNYMNKHFFNVIILCYNLITKLHFSSIMFHFSPKVYLSPSVA